MLRRARPLLGTFVEIATEADTEERAFEASAAAFDAVAEAQRRMSFHDPESDLSRVNRGALHAPVEVDAATFAVLARALEIAEASDGLFDPTVGAALVRCGVRPPFPAAPALAAAAPAAGCTWDGADAARPSWRDVELLPGRRVRFARPLAIDLGGIAKGYAVDRAIDALARHGARSACVNAGGDLRAIGDAEWPVALRHPRAPGARMALEPLRGGALATTADDAEPAGSAAERAGGEVVDPATGRLRRAPRSVTVRAPRCIDADALTKVVWLAEAPPLALLECYGASALVVCAGPAD